MIKGDKWSFGNSSVPGNRVTCSRGLEAKEDSVFGGQKTQHDHSAGQREVGEMRPERWGAGTRSGDLYVIFVFK